MSNLAPFSIIDSLEQFAIKAEAFNIPAHYLDKLIATNYQHDKHIVNDSREVKSGDVFCAIIGHEQDGRDYIEQVIRSGAILIIAECESAEEHGTVSWTEPKATGLLADTSMTVDSAHAVAIVMFYRLNKHLFELAKTYYQQPQDSMTTIGITGTNGKTSTCQIIAKLLDANKYSCGVIGTNGVGRVDALKAIINTTPGATQLHQFFSAFVKDELTHVAMEVSSHALHQGRVTSNLFDIAVYTNLSRDHLDYHQTMTDYAQAKRTIFSGQKNQVAILNGDDEQSQKWLIDWPEQQPVIVYGRSVLVTNASQYLHAIDIKHHDKGVTFLLNTATESIIVNSPLMADFNIDNLLAAIAVLLTCNLTLEQIIKSISQLSAVDGRMETTTTAGKPTAIVDYAHTPDALEKALIACRQHCQGELWVVFGCGGDRDKGKRALMGAVAEQHAEHLIITNDNPRSEIPESIIDDILLGCQSKAKVKVIIDREQAVLWALSQAQPDDFVLLAGKGHEDYIIIGNKRMPYNEREVVNGFYQQGATS